MYSVDLVVASDSLRTAQDWCEHSSILQDSRTIVLTIRACITIFKMLHQINTGNLCGHRIAESHAFASSNDFAFSTSSPTSLDPKQI
jgi:hypothetical protein